jgi:hypothetical protein
VDNNNMNLSESLLEREVDGTDLGLCSMASCGIC